MSKMYRVTGKEKAGFAVVDGQGVTVYDLLDSKCRSYRNMRDPERWNRT